MTEPADGFPITSRVTDLDQLPDGAEHMHSIVRGRNDYDVAPPAAPGDGDTWIRERELFLECRDDVHAGRWPTTYFEALGITPDVPAPLGNHGGVFADLPNTAAELVDHAMDHPYDLHRVFQQHYTGVALKSGQAARRPQQAGVDFLGWRMFDAHIANVIAAALVEAFQVKYHFVLPRPEHYFDVGALVAVYRCPPHPSYVAGHGAIAGATVQAWLDHVDLDNAQRAEVVNAGLHYAHYRTLAGVHWAQDNTVGFGLGQSVAA